MAPIKKQNSLQKKYTKRDIPFYKKCIEKNENINWGFLASHCYLSEAFIKYFWEFLPKNTICYYQKLSEAFIEQKVNEIDWYIISEQQRLSKNFIRKYKDKVTWDQICYSQNLSEDFVEEFKDYVSWEYVSMGNFSIKFIEKFRNYIDWTVYSIWSYNKMSNFFILRNYDKVKWDILYDKNVFVDDRKKWFRQKIDKDKNVKLHLLLNYRDIYNKIKESNQI